MHVKDLYYNNIYIFIVNIFRYYFVGINYMLKSAVKTQYDAISLSDYKGRHFTFISCNFPFTYFALYFQKSPSDLLL